MRNARSGAKWHCVRAHASIIWAARDERAGRNYKIDGCKTRSTCISVLNLLTWIATRESTAMRARAPSQSRSHLLHQYYYIILLLISIARCQSPIAEQKGSTFTYTSICTYRACLRTYQPAVVVLLQPVENSLQTHRTSEIWFFRMRSWWIAPATWKTHTTACAWLIFIIFHQLYLAIYILHDCMYNNANMM